MTVIPYVLTLMPVVVVGLVFLMLGDLHHSGILFGNSVPVEFPSSATGRRILRGYRWRGVVALAVFLVFGILAIRRGRIDFDLLAVPVEIVIWFALYFIAFHQTGSFAIQPPLVRTASLTPNGSIQPMIAGFVAALIPLLIAAFYLHLHWSQIPTSFPIHWGMDGQANGWSRRTVIGVYLPVWIGAAVIGVLFAIGFSTRYARGKESFRGLMRRILLLTSGFLSFTFVWVALLPLFHSTARMESMMPQWAIVLALLSAGIILFIVSWSIRAQLHLRAIDEPYDGTVERCWHGGMLYFNPDDPAILVPRRIGIGYAINFGRPASWLYVSLVLVPLGFLLFYKLVH